MEQSKTFEQLQRELQKELEYAVECTSVSDFVHQITKRCINDDKYVYLFRGEFHNYKNTILYPFVFRNPKWVGNENIMLQSVVNKFPDHFYKGMRTFDTLVDVQHYGLPTRLLDFSYSPLVALFMSAYNFSKDEITQDDYACVYAVKIKREAIKIVNSDAVALLSNVAKMDKNFRVNTYFTKKDYDKILHIIKDERSDFYNMYYDAASNKDETSKYVNDFDKIICVQPLMSNKRIVNQQGLFMLFGINCCKENIRALKVDYEEALAFKVPDKFKDNVLEEISLLGFNKMTMFPDLQTVCEGVKEQYSK